MGHIHSSNRKPEFADHISVLGIDLDLYHLRTVTGETSHISATRSPRVLFIILGSIFYGSDKATTGVPRTKCASVRLTMRLIFL